MRRGILTTAVTITVVLAGGACGGKPDPRRRDAGERARDRLSTVLRRYRSGDAVRRRLRRHRAGRRDRADRARDRGCSCRDGEDRDRARRSGRAGGATEELPLPRRGRPLHERGLEPACTEPCGRGVALRRLLHLDSGAGRQQDDPSARSGVAHTRSRPAFSCDGRGTPDRLAVVGDSQQQDLDGSGQGVPPTDGGGRIRRLTGGSVGDERSPVVCAPERRAISPEPSRLPPRPHEGDGSAGPTKGLVFVVGFGQRTQNLSSTWETCAAGSSDSGFWAEADGLRPLLGPGGVWRRPGLGRRGCTADDPRQDT